MFLVFNRSGLTQQIDTFATFVTRIVLTSRLGSNDSSNLRKDRLEKCDEKKVGVHEQWQTFTRVVGSRHVVGPQDIVLLCPLLTV